MPDSTPIYSFPYPCPGEAVTAGSFSALANAIDAKLNSLKDKEFAALHRPIVDQFVEDFLVAVGVETPITGPGSSFVIPINGIYIVNVKCTADGGFNPPMTGAHVRVRQNAVNRFGNMIFPPTAGNSPNVNAVGPIVGTTGDVMDVTVRQQGAAPVLFDLLIRAKMIVALA